MTVSEAAAAFLACYAADQAGRTYAEYKRTIDAFTARFGGQDVYQLDPAEVADWFRAAFGNRKPQGWNAARAALRSMRMWWNEGHPGKDDGQGWVIPDPFSRIAFRKVPADRGRALGRDQVRQLLEDRRVPLRERLLWHMLYESAARVNEVLSLDVEQLDRANNQAPVRRKGGAADRIVWKTATKRLLTMYLDAKAGGHAHGPVFVTERAGKSDARIGPGDLDEQGRARLSYSQAEDLWKHWTAELLGEAKTLHQLRHSALTHDAEDGWDVTMLKTKSGHTSLRSLERYARPSTEALARMQREHDQNRRH
jgi:integrase/recombinase XerC/integrase/recombinase XerD